MAYIFKQKLQIQDLVDIKRQPNRVLVYEPEEYLSALYGHYLRMHNFDVWHAAVPSLATELALIYPPDVVIFSVNNTKALAVSVNWIVKFKKDFPNSYVVTVGMKIDTEDLKHIMSAGVSGHINRQLSRPQDLVTIVKNILSN